MSSAKLSPTATTEFLNELETSEALPKDTWYFIAAAALCVLNRPEEVALVFKHAVDNCSDTKDQLRVARRIREALIKSGAVGGLPKVSKVPTCSHAHPPNRIQVIQTLLVLKRHTPAYLLDDAGLSTSRSRDFVETPPEEVFARGRAFWNAVYGQNADKLMHILNSCGTPDLGAAARMGYSFFLSHTDILTASETMFVTVSGAIVTDVSDPSFQSVQRVRVEWVETAVRRKDTDL